MLQKDIFLLLFNIINNDIAPIRYQIDSIVVVVLMDYSTWPLKKQAAYKQVTRGPTA